MWMNDFAATLLPTPLPDQGEAVGRVRPAGEGWLPRREGLDASPHPANAAFASLSLVWERRRKNEAV